MTEADRIDADRIARGLDYLRRRAREYGVERARAGLPYRIGAVPHVVRRDYAAGWESVRRDASAKAMRAMNTTVG